MPDLSIDHLYRETHHWIDSVAWWQKLGFDFVERWGEEPHRAGKLQRDGMAVVLAEVPLSSPVSGSVFIATDDLGVVARQAGRDIVTTHWGTELVAVEDPDGRTYNFETRNETE
jgi:hypothetical protein